MNASLGIIESLGTMALQLTNTLNKQKTAFHPNAAGRVGIYVCGPTVYDHAHLGHARSALFYDVLVRYLESKGHHVCYVRNITDLDDKIIDAAARRQTDYRRLASYFVTALHRDMDRLNIRRPTHEPRASAFIETMQHRIATLLQRGHAYRSRSDVYFSIDTIREYGTMSGLASRKSSVVHRLPPNPAKRDPLDFALWKSKPDTGPTWESPWGRGRPGWHIECTAMASELLGPNFDIHGGGSDLIFPHHENEIAQTQGVYQKLPANYWVHHELVNCSGCKMSKSDGAPITIREITKKFHPEAVRLYLLSKSYRRPIDYSHIGMQQATAQLNRLYSFYKYIRKTFGTFKNDVCPQGRLWSEFCRAMDDDVDIGRGCAVLFKKVGDLRKKLSSFRSTNASAEAKRLRKECVEVVGILQSILGILVYEPAEYFSRQRQLQNDYRFLSREKIELLIAARARARKDRQWEEADQMRNELNRIGVQIRDTPEGTRWKYNKKRGTHISS